MITIRTAMKGIRDMAFGIIIYEKDSYLYALMKERLSAKFPQAYIKQAGIEDRDVDLKLIDEIFMLYDDRQFNPSELPREGSPIPIFTDDGKGHRIIDMRMIYEKLTGIKGTETSTVPSGYSDKDRLKLLISYAYIDERETFIKQAIGPESFDCMHPIRIDLMSGIRMPTTFTSDSEGSVTKLLRACENRRFRPAQILEYLNPDSSGFLSCGKPENEDDVFDLGSKACKELLGHLKALCEKEDTGALVVVEGWRVSELTEFIPFFDTLHILLPARMCTEDTGMTKELGMFKRALSSGSLMTVHYCEDYRQQYESINI